MKSAVTLLLALSVSLLPAAHAATYYVSNAGDDSLDGLSPQTAWRTLARAQRTVAPGDTILLRRGDVFRESANFGDERQARLTFSAYGLQDSPNPVVSGSIPITGWKRHQGNIYVATAPQPVQHLFVDGRLMLHARYPNQGWLRAEKWDPPAGGRGGTITCPALKEHPANAKDYWAGARIRWRRWSWWHETRDVLSYDPAGLLTVSNIDREYERDPFWSGFYLEGKLEELDAPGEWHLDRQGLQVYLWAPEGQDPNSLLVEGTVLPEGLTVRDSRVEQITFRHQTSRGLHILGQTTVSDCQFQGIDGAALFASWSARNALVRGCAFEGNLNNAIVWNESPESGGASIIEHNVIRDTGMVPGYEDRRSWHAVGICIYNASNLRVRFNRVEGTGYAGIFIGKDGNYVEHNVVRRAMATLNDGAGIYANCNRSVIRNNIILDTVGNLESSHRIPYRENPSYDRSWPWANLGHGIWLEFLGDFRGSIVEGNTCAGCGGYGIFLPNNFGCVIRNNILYNNARAQLELSGFEQHERTDRTVNLPQNHRIEGNLLCAAAPEQATLLFRPQYDYGLLCGNLFWNPYNESHIQAYGAGQQQWTRTPMTLAQWQQQFPWADRAPRPAPCSPTQVEPGSKGPGTAELFVNDSLEPRLVQLGEAVWHDLDGRVVQDHVLLPPISSLVLVRCADRELVPPRRRVAADGGAFHVEVVAPHQAAWSARSDREWLVLEGSAQGRGCGAVRYRVMPNATPAERTATITIDGLAHTVTQSGAAE